jgi:hypothetical protein
MYGHRLVVVVRCLAVSCLVIGRAVAVSVFLFQSPQVQWGMLGVQGLAATATGHCVF